MEYSHGQADLDLGNYERFLDISLSKDNNLTTGKIYQVGGGSAARWQQSSSITGELACLTGLL